MTVRMIAVNLNLNAILEKSSQTLPTLLFTHSRKIIKIKYLRSLNVSALKYSKMRIQMTLINNNRNA